MLGKYFITDYVHNNCSCYYKKKLLMAQYGGLMETSSIKFKSYHESGSAPALLVLMAGQY